MSGDLLFSFHSVLLLLRIGDITLEDVDVIVNAANPSLLGGGGVDGAIHRAGGPVIREECLRIRNSRFPHGLPRGEAVITTGGNLKARFVIHTVGPICFGSFSERKKEILFRSYHNSFRLASDHSLRSIAFPAISTGAYGCPVKDSAFVAFSAFKEFFSSHSSSVVEVRFVFFLPRIFEVFREVASSLDFLSPY